MTQILLLILFGYVWLWLCIFLHELAHFSVGRALGLAPYGLLVGHGPLLFSGKWRGAYIRLHLRPSYGFTLSPLERPDVPPWREVFYFSAGLISDCLMFGVLLFLLIGRHIQTGGPGAFLLLVGWHAGLIISNLIPRDANIGGQAFPTDGKQIWNTLAGHAPDRTRHAREIHARAVRHYEPGYNPTNAPGYDWTERGDPALVKQYREGLVAAALDDAATARAKLLPVLGAAGPAMHPGEQAHVLDVLASRVLYRKEHALYPQALDWTARARALLPACATLRGTYGALLIECAARIVKEGGTDAGARAGPLIEEGLQLLRPLTEEGQARIDQVIATRYIAQAHALRGDKREQAEWTRRIKGFQASSAPWSNQGVRPVIRVAAAFFSLCGILACGGFAIMTLREGLRGFPLQLILTLAVALYTTLLATNIAIRGRAPAGWLPWK